MIYGQKEMKSFYSKVNAETIVTSFRDDAKLGECRSDHRQNMARSELGLVLRLNVPPGIERNAWEEHDDLAFESDSDEE
jgi:hypothetical protein